MSEIIIHGNKRTLYDDGRRTTKNLFVTNPKTGRKEQQSYPAGKTQIKFEVETLSHIYRFFIYPKNKEDESLRGKDIEEIGIKFVRFKNGVRYSGKYYEIAKSEELPAVERIARVALQAEKTETHKTSDEKKTRGNQPATKEEINKAVKSWEQWQRAKNQGCANRKVWLNNYDDAPVYSFEKKYADEKDEKKKDDYYKKIVKYHKLGKKYA